MRICHLCPQWHYLRRRIGDMIASSQLHRRPLRPVQLERMHTGVGAADDMDTNILEEQG